MKDGGKGLLYLNYCLTFISSKMRYLLVAVILFSFSCVSLNGSVARNFKNTGFFWHVTDIHVDQNYSRTGNPKQLCHNENTQYPDNGLYGNFLCDSPEYLVNVTFQAMKKIKSNPDFIIWTGDNLPHTLKYDADWDVIYEALNNVTLYLSKTFPGTPVYPCIGNHDTFPPNMLLPNETSGSIYKDILIRGGWNKYLKEESTVSFINGGYFSQVIRPGLRIISLNTILWYTPNDFTAQIDDPANQFKWFEETLNNSSKSSEKVYIIGHVPPGFYNRVKPGEKSDPTYHPQHLNAYLKILKKYSNIIIGQMFGHLHMDMFQLYVLETGRFVSSSILASSVTPWHFESQYNVSIPVNPSIRLMHYDRTSGQLKDYEQFFLNLTKANKLAETEKSADLYELLYTFTEAYNVPDVSTESLIQVFENIKKNETLFDMFYKFSTAGKESFSCDYNCKVAQLCSVSSTSISEYNNCMGKKSGPNFLCNINDNSSKHYSNFFAYGLAIVISCLSIFLLYIAYQKYRKSHSELYTKLLRDFD